MKTFIFDLLNANKGALAGTHVNSILPNQRYPIIGHHAIVELSVKLGFPPKDTLNYSNDGRFFYSQYLLNSSYHFPTYNRGMKINYDLLGNQFTGRSGVAQNNKRVGADFFPEAIRYTTSDTTASQGLKWSLPFRGKGVTSFLLHFNQLTQLGLITQNN